MQNRTVCLRTSTQIATVGLASVLALLSACAGGEGADELSETSLYALVEGIDGVYFYPPLGPTPAPAGAFEGSLVDGLTVSIQAEDASGSTTVATFDRRTTPAVALLATHERYFVNIPAGTYFTDPAKTYSIRVALDGQELGASILSGRIFEFLARNPAMTVGVHVRVEGSGAVRSSAPARFRNVGAPLHCSDGVRNKDESGVDCGGTCAPCPTCEDGIQNQSEEDVDCGGPCAPCATCTDGVQNQGEERVDCGGPCTACPTCGDGVQNQGEVGVDCGGPCPAIDRVLAVSDTRYGALAWVHPVWCSGWWRCPLPDGAQFIWSSYYSSPQPSTDEVFETSVTVATAPGRTISVVAGADNLVTWSFDGGARGTSGSATASRNAMTIAFRAVNVPAGTTSPTSNPGALWFSVREICR